MLFQATEPRFLMNNLPEQWPFPPSGGPQKPPEQAVEGKVAKKRKKRPKRDLSNIPSSPF